MTRPGVIPFFVLLSVSAAFGRTIVVDVNGGGEFTEIQPAIDASEDGDEVLVKAGEYVITEPIRFGGKGITVHGEAGADGTVVRVSETPADPASARVLVFQTGETAASVMEGFTLTGGRCAGLGISGGGVHISGSSPTLIQCTISGNSSTDSGGGLYCGGDSSPTFIRCTISGNRAIRSGGGMDCGRGSPTLTDCVISGNSAPRGSGVYCSSSSPEFTNSTISGNSGGGVYCGPGSSPTLVNCILWDNAGGSIWLEGDASAHATYSCIGGGAGWPGEGNIHDDPLFCGWGDVGEVHVDGGAHTGPGLGTQEDPFSRLEEALDDRLYSLALSPESPCRGAGQGGVDMGAAGGTCERAGEATRLVYLAPWTYTSAGVNLSHRVSIQGAGEAETVIQGTVTGLRTGARLSHLTVTRGTDGGILVNDGESPEIVHCTISKSTPSGVRCGNGSSPVLAGCTISGNWAYEGGGLYCVNASPSLTNCVITGNRARTAICIMGICIGGQGGVIFCSNSSPTFTNCTISGNSATRLGGAAYCEESSSPTFTNCIVWGNPPEAFLSAQDSPPIVTYSCVEGDEVWPGTGNIHQDPLFAGTDDYHLGAGSPAIDGGTFEGAPEVDMEGKGRPCGRGVDMGAYERGDCIPPAPFRRGDPGADGKRGLEDAQLILQYIFHAIPPDVPCLKSGDWDDSGKLALADVISLLVHIFGEGPPAQEPFDACGHDPTMDVLGCDSYPPCAP